MSEIGPLIPDLVRGLVGQSLCVLKTSSTVIKRSEYRVHCSGTRAGALASVGAFGFLRKDGRHGVEALWRAAVHVEDRKLVSFLVFFLSLAMVHRFLVTRGAWEDEICSIRLPAEISISPKPVLASAVWTLGACGFFGYVGILIQA